MSGTNVAVELARLGACGRLLAVKVYRVDPGPDLRVPVIPCLDHEAMLHQHVAPHVSAYLLEPTHNEIHEVGVYPASHTLKVDTVSTLGEFSPASHRALTGALAREFPGFRIDVIHPSWWRAERRVADACRAQLTLRDVLIGDPSDALKRQIDKLQIVGALMEKQSRVASWGVRTIAGQILAAIGVMLYATLGAVAPRLGLVYVSELQYVVVGTIGA